MSVFSPAHLLRSDPATSSRSTLEEQEHAKALTTCSTCSHLHGEVLCNIALALCNIALAPGQQQAASGRP